MVDIQVVCPNAGCKDVGDLSVSGLLPRRNAGVADQLFHSAPRVSVTHDENRQMPLRFHAVVVRVDAHRYFSITKGLRKGKKIVSSHYGYETTKCGQRAATVVVSEVGILTREQKQAEEEHGHHCVRDDKKFGPPSNENTNRLLRFWFEKGSDLSTHTPEDLRRTAAKLNRRPAPPRTSIPQPNGWTSCSSQLKITALLRRLDIVLYRVDLSDAPYARSRRPLRFEISSSSHHRKGARVMSDFQIWPPPATSEVLASS